jgi:PAS domain S-box-containing protein
LPWEALARSPASIALVAADGSILQATAQFCELFGYQAAEVSGMRVEQLLPEEFREQHGAFRAEFLTSPIDRRMSPMRDLVGLTRHGDTIPVEISLTPIEHDGAWMTLAWVFDRREHKAQDERFRLAIEGAPSGIVFVDDAGRIVHCNKQACEDFGYNRTDLIGQEVETLTPAATDSGHANLREGYLRDPVQRRMGQGRELYARRKDGSEFPVEIGLTPIPYPGQTWTMASIVNIASRKRTEEQLVSRNEDLLNFVYSASHDLKAPLSTIRGLVSIARDDLEEGELGSVADLLELVEVKAKKLSDLVEATLALARADRSEEQSELIVLADLLAEIVAQTELDAAHSRVEVSFAAPPETTLYASPRRVQMVLENLIRNSIKYHHPSREDRYVHVDVTDRRREVVIEVRDNGIGISPRHHPKVFEMFQRFHPDRADGSGLGLAMVRKQVTALGGEIAFDSTPEGTTFRIELPKDQPQ